MISESCQELDKNQQQNGTFRTFICKRDSSLKIAENIRLISKNEIKGK